MKERALVLPRPRNGFVRRLARRVTKRAAIVGAPGRELLFIAWQTSYARVRNKWAYYALVMIGVAVATVLIALLPAVTHVPWLASGFVAGLGSTAAIATLLWVLLISDGSMRWRVGAIGELWTAGELRRLGSSWTVLNSLRLPGANDVAREIDHVAVGPGGVLVVDSKLRPTKRHQLDTKSSPDINSAALGARQQAGVVRLLLRDIAPEDLVSATVMFWGSELLSPPELVVTDRHGVHIVHGRASAPWLNLFAAGERLESERAAAVIDTLLPFLVPKLRLRDVRTPIEQTQG